MSFFDGDPRPGSSRRLQVEIQRMLAEIPDATRRKRALRNIQNAILAQFLGPNAMVKGGAAISIRYGSDLSRKSRDFDASVGTTAQRFEYDMARRLHEGWEGFTGSIVREERRHGVNPDTGMIPYIVRVDYRGRPFHTYTFEASPDVSGFIPRAEPVLSEETDGMLRRLGFHPSRPMLVSRLDQLADKLHSISRPDARRGRDLADIALLVGDENPDLDELRERVRIVERTQKSGAHQVHMLDESRKSEYRLSFDQSSMSSDFDACWNTTQMLLLQVDINHRAEWRALWKDVVRDALPDSSPLYEDLDAPPPRHGRQSRKPKGRPDGGQFGPSM